MTTSEQEQTPAAKQPLELDPKFREEFIGPSVLVIRPDAFAMGSADYSKANPERVRK